MQDFSNKVAAITGGASGALLVYPDQPIYTASKAAVHATTPETDAKIRSRADMILNRENPVPNRVAA